MLMHDDILFFRCTGVEEDFVDPCFPILPIPERDQCIRFIRSAAVCQDNAYDLKPREQINVNTAFLDASMVYGSTERVQTAVRDLTSKYYNRIVYIYMHSLLLRPVQTHKFSLTFLGSFSCPYVL